MKKTILLFSVLAILTSSIFAQGEWSYNEHPELSGWDLDKLKDYNRFIIDSTRVTGLMIIHNGKVVFDYGDIKENSYIASCRKSVLSMLYGKYVENGVIDLDKTIEQLGIDDVEGILEAEQRATVRDLISARSGVYHPEGYPGGMQQFAPKRGSVEPGEHWLYSNWDFNVAGFVFEQETGKNIYDEVEHQLARPLGMEDWDRSLQVKEGDTTISKYKAYPIWFSTRDMARVGLLMLNRGNWYGKQVISEDWVSQMLAQRTTNKEINNSVPVFRSAKVNFGYGYMWWLFEGTDYEGTTKENFKGAYTALGAMGQAIVVYPEINVVLVYKTKAAYKRSNNGATQEIIQRKTAELYTPK